MSTKDRMPGSPGRFAYIDALRGFAILGVIITHAGSMAGLSGKLKSLSDIAGMGVELFFVVSAFTIFLTFARASSSETQPVRNFFIRRLFRIVPIYWAGILLYTAVYGLESRGWRPGPELWHFPMHLTLTNILHPDTLSSVVPGGWSISVEIMFYMTMPIWFMLVRSIKSSIVFTVTAALVSVVAIPLLRPLIDPFLPAYANLDEFWYRSFLSQMPCFGFGFILYFLTVSRSDPLEFLDRPIWNACLLLAAPVAFVVLKLGMPTHYAFCLASLMVAAALSRVPWRMLVNPITTFVGRVSYSAYLLHFLVIYELNKVLPAADIGAIPRFIVLLGAGTLITIPLAYGSYRAVELSFTALARRLIAAREERGAGRCRGKRGLDMNVPVRD